MSAPTVPSAAAAAEGVRGRVRPLVRPVMDLRMLLMATTTLSRARAEVWERENEGG